MTKRCEDCAYYAPKWDLYCEYAYRTFREGVIVCHDYKRKWWKFWRPK